MANTSRNNQLYPLSIAQNRLWFLHKLHNSGINNTILWLKITGNLDIEDLKSAIMAVIQRHEALRTRIISDQDIPYQTFDNEPKMIFYYSRFDENSMEKNLEKMYSAIHVESMQTFDLNNYPLHFAHLYETADHQYYFAWVFDHIISDGMSLNIIQKDLLHALKQQLEHNEIKFARQVDGYSKYILWENSLTPQDYENDKQYWKNKLENIPSRLDFPTYIRPTQRTFHGKTLHGYIDTQLQKELISFCIEKNITIFMFFSTVFALLIYRYTDQDDFVLGIPHANRNQLSSLESVGFFVNTILIRCQFTQQLNFNDILDQIRKNALEAYDHNTYPFERIVELLQPDRDTTRNPLFQFFLNTRAKKQFYSLPNLQIETLAPPPRGSNFDLTVYFQDIGNKHEIEFSFNPDIMPSALMKIFMEQFIDLCQQCVQNPNEKIPMFSLLPSTQDYLLPDPEAPLEKNEYPSVVELFGNIAKQYSENIAIKWKSKETKYKKLHSDAQKIAYFLLNQKLGPTDVIALSGSSSYGLISTFLGILMTGCTILLLDPTLPEQRKRVMLDQGKASLLFYADDETDSIVNYAAIQKEPYNSENGELVNPDDRFLTSCALPNINVNLPAYITFTSGTSGVPKGISGIHNSLSHFLIWQKDTFQINQKDHFAQLTNIGFDVIFRDILLPLISGATIHCPPNRTTIASKELFQWFSEEEITVLHTVPSLAKYWLSENKLLIEKHPLRLTFFAGEKLSLADCDAWHTQFDTKIINLYGPSETTLATSYSEEVLTFEIQPIGKPITGNQLLIINQAGKLAGVGEPGEIIIRTPYRSAGYLPAAEKNAFQQNPFTNSPGDLVYYSGDMGRYLSDGSIAFIGRMDHQIKILGNRIEPQEIQAVLLRHPQIKNAYVKSQFTSNNLPVLTAYVVPLEKGIISEAHVIDYLQQYLTRVSLPQEIVFLENIPITRNGKIDTESLPSPTISHKTSLQKTIKHPVNEIEEHLLAIWKKYLPDQTISTDDNFFQLGGHSLLALSLCAEISDQLNKKISIADFFRFPSIYQLGQYFQNPSSDKSNPILPLQTFGNKPPLFGTSMRNGSPAIYRLLLPFLSIDQPLYGLSISSNNINQSNSLEDIAKHHVDALLAFDADGPYYLCGYSYAGLVAFEVAYQLEHIGKKVAFLGIIDTWLEKYDRFSYSLNRIQNLNYKLKIFFLNAKFHILKISHLPIRGKIDYISSRLGKRVHIEQPDPDHLADAMVDDITQDFDINNHLKRLANEYKPQKIGTHIWLFRAEIPSTDFHAYPNTFGWHYFSKKRLSIKIVPGTHYSIMQGNEVKFLGETIQNVINQTRHR